MRLNVIVMAGFVLAGMMCGCGPMDPGSDAPGLAGSWAVQGGAADGCWVFDAQGDPVSFTPTNDTLGLGIAMYMFDGTPQALTLPGDIDGTLVSTGQATQNGDQVDVELTLRVTAVIEVAAATITWNATINAGTLAGQSSVSGTAITGPIPSSTADINGTLDGC